MLYTALLIKIVYSTLTNKIIIINRIGILSLLYTIYILIKSINIVSITTGITLFNNFFKINNINIMFIYIILIITTIILMYNTSILYNKKSIILENKYYIIIILMNIIGLIMLPLVNELITLYIIIELQGYTMYIITGIHKRSYNATKASLLYFLMGSIASTIILLSIYYLYDLTGTTNLSDIYLIKLYNNNNIEIYLNILIFGLMFKMGLAPLHKWSISVYNYTPTYITTYISIVIKISILAWIYTNQYLFSNNLLILFLFYYISLIIGSYKPLKQINIKNLLAYSSILNFGYIILAIITNDISIYIYLIQYSLTHIIIFISLLCLDRYIINPTSIWSPVTYFNQIKIPNLMMLLIFIISLFSLIGLPPLPGFYMKYLIIISALQENYVIETLFLILCSILATYYYAYFIKIIIKSYINYENKSSNINCFINPTMAYIISILTILTLIFSLYLPYLLEGLYIISI